MRLVKVKHENGKERTCLIDEIKNGGEYTTCGIAYDSSFQYESFEWTDKKTAKKPTCAECKKIIKWYKSL